MSTANARADVQTGREVVLPEHGQSELTEPKFTATQIEKNCPARLQQIATEIAERHERARKQAGIAADHLIAIEKLLAEAKGLCDRGGFNKFRELHCPNLRKSQAYALRAIAGGKKTFAEHRTEERERKRKSRANQKAVAANSGTVPEKPNEGDGSTGTSAPQVTNSTTEQTPEPFKPRSSVAPGDGALRAFTVLVMELDRRTAKRPSQRFSATAVPIDVLARLGTLLTDIANIKQSGTVNPVSIMGNATAPDEPAAMEPEHTALEASIDMVTT
jgi:hypothetical protein